MEKSILSTSFFLILLTASFMGCSKNTPVKNYISIARYLNEKPIPWDSVKKFYEKSKLKKELVIENKTLDLKIEEAIRKAQNNIKPHLQKQILSKDTQKHFCGKLANFFKTDINEVTEKKILKAQTYYDTIIALTARRRIKYLNKFNFKTPDKNLIHSLIVPSKFALNYSSHIEERSDLFDDLMKAKLSKNKNKYTSTIQKIEEFSVYVYYLAILYELDGIEKFRDSNFTKAEEKQLEGKIFFDIIEYYAELKACNSSSDTNSCKTFKKLKKEFISGILKPVKEMNIKDLLKTLKNLFPFFYK
jgi:hypothetical protein